MLRILWNRYRELGEHGVMGELYQIAFTAWLKNRLNNGPILVTFTKADGTQRVMNCTLDLRLISPLVQKTATDRKKKHGDLLTVWDIDKAAWRTLPLDRVRTIECDTGKTGYGDLPWETSSQSKGLRS